MGQNPTDRGQIGTTRRVLTDGGGVPVGRAGEGAKCHACQRARAPIASRPSARPEPTPDTPQGRGRDTGEDEAAVRELLTACGFTAHIRARGEEAEALT